MSQPATELPATEWLEQRVQRLESAVAALRDTQALEERVVERVAQQIKGNGRVEIQAPAITEPPTAAPAAHPVAQAVETAVKVAAVATPAGSKYEDLPWLMIDIAREFLAIFRMFFDLHYKVAWSTRVLTLILLPAILTSHWWVPLAHIPVVGPVLDKLVDVVLMFVMLKALHREARRYMTTRNTS